MRAIMANIFYIKSKYRHSFQFLIFFGGKFYKQVSITSTNVKNIYQSVEKRSKLIPAFPAFCIFAKNCVNRYGRDTIRYHC